MEAYSSNEDSGVGDLTICPDCSRPYRRNLRSLHESECVTRMIGQMYVWDGAPLSRDAQLREIESEMQKDNNVFGRPYFVLSYPWYAAWREHVSSEGPKPPAIDNSDLVLDTQQQQQQQGEQLNNKHSSTRVAVKPGLVLQYDYLMVPALVWQRFVAWYGGGPEIMRQTIRAGTRLVVDLYPVEVTCDYEDTSKDSVRFLISASNPFRMVRHWAATNIGSAPHRCNLSLVQVVDGKTNRKLLSADELKQTIEDSGLGSSIHVYLSNPAVHEGPMGSLGSGSGGGSFNFKPPENEVGETPARGVVGLHNLGNTCFMNSTLQCLNGVPAFVNLFVDESRFKPFKNLNNPMGTKGVMCDGIHTFIRDCWSGLFKVVAPNAFRKALQQFAPQFRGYQQHDAQEMLLVLLSLLHEDLTTGKDLSPIYNLFAGQYKSTVTCNECNMESTVYEPFLNLPVVVPEKERRKLLVTFYPADSKPIHVGVRVNRAGNVQHMLHTLAEVLELPGKAVERLTGIQLSGNTFFELNAARMISSIRENDRVVVFESGPSTMDMNRFFVFSFRQDRSGSYGTFGIPFSLWLQPGATGTQALMSIQERVSSLIGNTITHRDARLIKIGGGLDGSIEVPKGKLDLAAGWAFGVLWADHDVATISKSLERIPDHPSCQVSAEDAEMRVSLQECLNLSNTPEPLTVADGWCCPTCNRARAAVKIMQVVKAPKVLCLHLKRFKMDFVTKEKLRTLVVFPEELDFHPFVAGEMPKGNYRLVGVSNHIGGLSGGHYTAFRRTGDTWYEFDDRHFSEVESSKVVSPSAYVLFYVAEEAMNMDALPDAPVPVSAATGGGASVAKSEQQSAPPASSAVKESVIVRPVQERHLDQPLHAPHQHTQPEVENLTDSAYICDICTSPVSGGWTGLMEHCKRVHGIDN